MYGQYAEWGLDFIKNDCIYNCVDDSCPIAPGVTGLDVIKGVRRAMLKSGRDVSDEDLLADLSEGLEFELEKARVFNELETELFETGSDGPDEDGPETVGA